MKIYFQYFNKNKILLDIPDNITVEELKILIQDKEGIHSSFLNLYYNNLLLVDDCIINEYNIIEESTIYHMNIKYDIDYSKVKPINFPQGTVFNF